MPESFSREDGLRSASANSCVDGKLQKLARVAASAVTEETEYRNAEGRNRNAG